MTMSTTGGTRVLSDGTTEPARTDHPLDAVHPSRMPPQPARLRPVPLTAGQRVLSGAAGALAACVAMRRGGLVGLAGWMAGALFLTRAVTGHSSGFTRRINRLMMRV